MGKAQSKRSIDITTDPKKVGEGDEVAGKVEKIEDVDQKVGDGAAAAAAPPLNGDAATPKEGAGEAASSEKKDTEDHSENDKDLTTEKSASDAKGESGEGGASGDGAAETSKDEAAVAAGSPKDAAGAEEISPLADESIKSKSKKDKVKKKWSFRSISFGKKDKQKPAKTEEPVSPTAAAAASPEASPAAAEGSAAVPAEPTTNGEAAAPEQPKEEAAAVEPATTKDEVKPVENGSATAQEQQAANGGGDEKRPLTPPTTVEEPATKPEEITATTTETTAETAAKEPPTTATEVVTNGHGSATTEEVLTNGDKNGLASDESPVAESVNIPSKVDDVEEPHQNGTNGSATPPPTPVAVIAPAAESEAEQIKNKSQIEVNQIDITPSNNNAHNNNKNDTVNTSTKTLTTTTETETTETTTIITTTATETETTIAAADLVQTLTNTTNTTTNTVPTIPPPSHTTDTNNTNITDTLPGEEEEQVVQAIIAAVSSEADAEGFVVVSAAADPVVDQENDSSDVSPNKSEPSVEPVPDSIVLTEASNPPPLPKSPPPSRVSAFALAEEEDDDAATADDAAPPPAAPETNDNEKLPPSVQVEDDKANNTEIEKIESEPEEDISIEIEHQAQIIVDEITEQAAEIVKCECLICPVADGTKLQCSIACGVDEQDNNKKEPQIEEEIKQVINEDLISNEIREDLPEAAPIVVVEEDAEKTTPADGDADDDKSRLPESEVEQLVPEEVTDTQTEHDKLEISIDQITEKLEALPRLNGDHDDDDDAKANANDEDDLNELDRNNKDITKDLKEKNAAAADVTTQELPVTCE